MRTKKSFLKILTSVAMAATMLFSVGLTAHASTSTEAYNGLCAYVGTAGDDNNKKDGEGIDKVYLLEGGGTATYADCVDRKTGQPTATFAKLKESAKEECLKDMLGYANKAVDSGSVSISSNGNISAKGITEDVKTTWLQDIQNCDGVGTQLMNTLLQNTKPDYATANRIYEPFSGVVGTVLALGAILIMAFLGITMVLDLAYIGIPAFRLAFGGDGNGKDKPKCISHEAISAINLAENGDGGNGQNGSGKIAVGIYFKKRVVMLIVLGVCLLYLIQGQIFTLVSWILNLLSGFLGF